MRRFPTLIAIPLVLLGGVLLAAPVEAAAKVDYDPSADFSSYRTFRWLAAEGRAGGQESVRQRGPRARDGRGPASPLADKQIVEAVRSELEGKGLELVESGEADLAVAFHTGKQRELVGYGWGPRYAGPRRVAVHEEGTLTIDLIDRGSRELVWRGWIAAPLKDDPEKRHAQIRKLVGKVLANYPPAAKK